MLSTGFIVSHHPKEGLNTALFWWPAMLGWSSTDGLRAQVEGRKTHILWDGRTCPAQLPQKFFDRWEDVARCCKCASSLASEGTRSGKWTCQLRGWVECHQIPSSVTALSLISAYICMIRMKKCLSQWFQLISRQSRQCSPVGKINYSLSETRAGEKWRIETAKFQLVGDSLHIWVVISRGLSWPAVVSKSRTPFHPMI